MPRPRRLRPEIQGLLEEIFAQYGNEEEAQKDPETCLEALLIVIAEDASDTFSNLRPTLEFACPPGAAKFTVAERREKIPQTST
ncbi:MAG TPA: hypothetical protein VJC15_01530 [Candidatus Paceibacterota bacterium]